MGRSYRKCQTEANLLFLIKQTSPNVGQSPISTSKLAMIAIGSGCDAIVSGTEEMPSDMVRCRSHV